MTDTQTIREGDLVELTTPLPWGPDKPVGTTFIVDSDLYGEGEEDGEFPGVEGPFFDPADPRGMWFGGDPVPVSHVRLVQAAADTLPSTKKVASAMRSALVGMDSGVIDIDEVGEQSEDGVTLYAVGTTPVGVRVRFLVLVGQIERAEA